MRVSSCPLVLFASSLGLRSGCNSLLHKTLRAVVWCDGRNCSSELTDSGDVASTSRPGEFQRASWPLCSEPGGTRHVTSFARVSAHNSFALDADWNPLFSISVLAHVCQ